jgi:hypothetical protein
MQSVTYNLLMLSVTNAECHILKPFMLSVVAPARSLPEWTTIAKMYPSRKHSSLLFKIVDCSQKGFDSGPGLKTTLLGPIRR